MIVNGDEIIEFPNHISFGQYVLDQMRRTPGDDVCLENGVTGETLTYKEASQYIVNLTVGLSKLGIQRGDVMAIGSEPFMHYATTALAVTMSGAIFTSYGLEIGKAMLQHKMQLSKPKYFICSSQFWQAYQDVLNSFECIETYIALSDIPEMCSLTSLTAVDVDIEGFVARQVQAKTDTALIIYTSGTTGMPKGVQLTHYCCMAKCYDTYCFFRKRPLLKRAFALSPFSATFTLSTMFRFFLLGGRTVYTPDRSTETLLKIILNSKVDVIFSSPVHLREMANSEIRKDHMDSVKIIVLGGFALRADTTQMFKQRFPHVDEIIQFYALTECGTVTSELYTLIHKPGSAGVAAPGMMIKVVDPATRSILGPNKPGEVFVKGPTIMKGYIDLNSSNYMDEDGFYKTGDIGYFDDEKYFYIVERIKDIIVSKFAKISPLELENVLLQHPAVMDAGVVGKPDAVLNEVPAAFVVKRPGCDVTESELMDFVATKVAPNMRLKGGLTFISRVPRNDGGKTLRRQLKKMLEENA